MGLLHEPLSSTSGSYSYYNSMVKMTEKRSNPVKNINSASRLNRRQNGLNYTGIRKEFYWNRWS